VNCLFNMFFCLVIYSSSFPYTLWYPPPVGASLTTPSSIEAGRSIGRDDEGWVGNAKTAGGGGEGYRRKVPRG